MHQPQAISALQRAPIFLQELDNHIEPVKRLQIREDEGTFATHWSGVQTEDTL